MDVDPEDAARWREYFMPGSDHVLRNCFGFTYRVDLTAAEDFVTVMRAAEIREGAVHIPQTFDADHLRAIHGHLFQDVYDWAGEFRTVGMVKTGNSFLRPHQLEPFTEKIHETIVEIPWATLEHDQVPVDLAHVYKAVNVAHHFREGNGRTARLFMNDVAHLAGWELQDRGIGRAELVEAARQAYIGHTEEVEALFAKHAKPLADPTAPRPRSTRAPATREQVRALFAVDPDRTESIPERLERLAARRDPVLDLFPPEALGRPGLHL